MQPALCHRPAVATVGRGPFFYIYISKGNNGKNATKLLLTTFVVCNFSHNSEDLKQK